MYRVTSIGEYAFYNCKQITSVAIPDGVTSIGKEAFSDCSTLTSITMPNSVTTIGESAFSSCYGLTSIIIPNSVTSIGDNAFTWCRRLSTVTMGESIYSIGKQAFSDCFNLSSITLKARKIGDNVLENCSNLTSVTIDSPRQYDGSISYVYQVGSDLFSGCEQLSSVVWNVNYVGNDIQPAFSSVRSQIKSFTFGEHVKSIPFALCSGMGRLAKVSIPDSVIEIGESAFKGCVSLSSVLIGNSVTTIADRAFLGCFQLTSVVIPNSVKYLSGFTGTGLTSIQIPESVTVIGKNAFDGCQGLTSVTLPNSVTHIEECAFKDTKITSIIIPENVTSVGQYAFACPSLESVGWNAILCTNYEGKTWGEKKDTQSTSNVYSFSFGNKVKVIPGNLCSKLWKLKKVVIPSSVDSIGSGVFADCDNLESIQVENGNHIYDSRNNCNAIIRTKDNALVAGCQSTIIPKEITSIEDYAFAGHRGIFSITIPDGVTNIGRYAFVGCINLSSITIPHGITTIKEHTFRGCAISSIIMPDGVTSIEDYAFAYCKKLTTITIPETMKNVCLSAFDWSRNIESIVWNATNCDVSDFSMWTSLRNDYRKKISFTLGRNVETIPVVLFGATPSLTVKAQMPPRLIGTPPSALAPVIYIPCGTKQVYSAVSDWGKYSKYFQEAPSNTLEVSVSDSDAGKASITKSHTCDDEEAQIKAYPYVHYHFIQWSDGNTDNPRSVFVTSDTCFVAEFESDPQYIVTVTCDSLQGSVKGAGSYYAGGTATITATAFEGYEFKQWWHDGQAVSENPYRFVVEKATALEAEFVPASAVDNVNVTSRNTSQKFFRDGQLFILYDGKMYDALGNEVTIRD